MARRLHAISDAAGLSLADEALALTIETTAALVPDRFGTAIIGIVSELDLEVWSNAAVSLTNADLRAGVLHDRAIAGTALDAITNATDLFTEASHGWLTGDGPVVATTADTLPTGISLVTNYWLIYVSANTFRLATSLENALAGTYVEIDDDGTGAMTITGADAQRVHWHSAEGLLGPDADGAIVLTASAAYAVKVDHDPMVCAYAFVGTMSASNPEWVGVKLYPRMER